MSSPAREAASGGTGYWRSPGTWSGSRLVTRSVRRGHAVTSSRIEPEAAETCSKLSTRSSVFRLPSSAFNVSASGTGGASSTPIMRAISGRTRPGSVTIASSTANVPSSNSSTRSAATCIARRVLPVPPGPVRVTSRTSSSRTSRRTASSSSSRPMSGVGCAGRFVRLPSSVRRGGNSVGRPGTRSWCRRCGRLKSLSLCSPRSRKLRPSTSSRVVSETSTWPPCAAPAMRAAR